MPIAGRRCACTGLRSFPFCGVRRPGKAQPPPGKTWRMAPDTHCRATLRLHRPAVLPLPLEFPGPVRRIRHRAKRGAWRRIPVAGRRCACTGLRSFPFCGARRPGKAQPPPGKTWRMAPDVHCRAALRLHRPAVFPLPLEFAGPIRRSRHRGVRLPYQSSSWPRMRNIS